MTDIWFAGTQKPGAKARVFCFPFASGGVLIYRDWSRFLPPEIEVRPVKLPGRDGRFREKCYEDVIALVDDLIPQIEPLLDLPFVLFGHSMGSLLAFELARGLRRHGKPQPLCLMPSARRAPDIPLTTPPRHKLPDLALKDLIRNYGGTPQIILDDKDLMEFFLPVVRADFAMNDGYQYTPEPPLDCPICVFGAEQDEHVDGRHQLEAWERQTTGNFALHMFPGGHFFITEAGGPRLVRTLATEIQRLLG